MVRTSILYVALGWGAIEVLSTLGQIFAWPELVVRALVVAIVLGLPVAIGISWWFDLTPDGLLPDGGDTRDSVTDATSEALTGSRGDKGAPSNERVRISVPPPAAATPLLGRSEALASASEHLRGGARMLTVTGIGGTGKTRFAVELFGQLHADYPGGAAFVSLASVEDADEVMSTVAAALKIAEAHGRSAVGAIATVIGNDSVLLVLDNLEQVVDCAPHIGELIAACPSLRVIATSRAPLKIAAEVELPLPPLALPPAVDTAPEDLSLYPAVELFVQRANKVKSDFTITAENAQAVAAICRRLDGLPLALELAAARIRILRPQALLDRLDQALDVLTSGDRDLPERQRTLRATVAWSYDLLDEGEQRLLRCLSVFSDGWSYEAMESVCYTDATRAGALDELHSLVEKGLVQHSSSDDRYSMLVTIRAFAAEGLAEAGEAADAQRRHADYFVEHARGVHEGITGRDQLPAMARARVDAANMTSSLQSLTARGAAGDVDAIEKGLLIAGYHNWVWHITGQHQTARSVVDDLLGLAADHPPSLGRSLAFATAGLVSNSTGEMERGREEWTSSFEDAEAIGSEHAMSQAGVGLGFTLLMLGRLDEARSVLEACIERSGRNNETFFHAVSMAFLGNIDGVSGDLDTGIDRIQRAIELCEGIDDHEVRGCSMSFVAQLHYMKGDAATALRHYTESLTSLELVGDRPEIARVHGEMGWAALSLDAFDEARISFLESLRWYDEVGSPPGKGTALTGLAVVEAAVGNVDRALTVAAAADVMAEQAGVVIEHAMNLGAGDRIESLRAGYDPQALAAITEAGRAMSPSEILALVTGGAEVMEGSMA